MCLIHELYAVSRTHLKIVRENKDAHEKGVASGFESGRRVVTTHTHTDTPHILSSEHEKSISSTL